MEKYFFVILASLISVLFLFLLTKLMGARQISQLTFFDYVVGISIGSIAAEMACDLTLNFTHGVIAMATFSLVSLIFSYISQKSMRARKFITGTPIVIIAKGEILRENLKKVKLDINELLMHLRTQGYFNVGEIYYAVMEPTGVISVIPKELFRPLCVYDGNLNPSQTNPCPNIIIDGKILYDNLKAIKKDELWLKDKLEEKGYKLKDIALSIYDGNDLLIFKNNYNSPKTNFFD